MASLRAGSPFGALWRWQSTRAHGVYLWHLTGTGGMVALMLAAGLPVRWVATPDAPAVDLVAMPEPPR